MSAKIIVVLCVQALFVQLALSQCTSRAAIAAAPGIGAPALGLAAPCGLAASLAAPYGLGSPYGIAAPYGLAAPCGWNTPALDFTPTSGGLLPVTSGSALAPIGLAIESENYYEGALAVGGELPFVGTVGLEGVLPTAGAGVVNHACGNGVNAMISEGAAFAPGYPAAIAPAAALAAPGIGLTGPYGLAGSALGLAGPYGLAGYRGRGCGFGI